MAVEVGGGGGGASVRWVWAARGLAHEVEVPLTRRLWPVVVEALLRAPSARGDLARCSATQVPGIFSAGESSSARAARDGRERFALSEWWRGTAVRGVGELQSPAVRRSRRSALQLADDEDDPAGSSTRGEGAGRRRPLDECENEVEELLALLEREREDWSEEKGGSSRLVGSWTRRNRSAPGGLPTPGAAEAGAQRAAG